MLIPLILIYIFFSLFFYQNNKPIYYRFFYPWDRIQGTIQIEVDGVSYRIKPSDLKVRLNPGPFESSRIPKLRFRNGSNKLSFNATGYGPYRVDFQIDGITQRFQLGFYQFNWWNVTDFDCNIQIDTKTGDISVDYTATELEEDGSKYTSTNSLTFQMDEDKEIYIQVVWI